VAEHVGVRELRNNTAAAVRRAGAGERLVVTVDGRPTAQLGPLDPVGGEVTLADLAARGLVVAPRRTGPATAPENTALWTGTRVGRVVREVRGG
jgi:prevent-host-death family protein